MTAAGSLGRPWALLGVAIAFLGVFAFALPVWQIHDDIYYSMLAQGWGIVSSPSADIPFMHPAIGKLAVGLTQLTGGAGYAIMIYLLLGTGLLCGLAVLVRQRVGQAVCSLFLAASLALFLIPQYTTVAGYLAVVAMLLLFQDGRPWVAGGALLLLLVAAALRAEIVLLAFVLSVPFMFAAFRSRTASLLHLALVSAGVGTAIAIVVITTPTMRSPVLVEFNHAHSSLVPFVDYGYATIRQGKQADDAVVPLDDMERELLANWFLADASLFPPQRLDAIAKSVTLGQRISSFRWMARKHLTELPELVYFWMLLATAVVALASRRTKTILASVAIFLSADLLFACLGRPFPERVGLGLAVGIFLLALVACGGSLRLPSRFVWAGAGGVLLLGFGCLYQESYSNRDWNVEPLRAHLQSRSSDIVYFQTSHLPWQALFRPLGQESKALPRLISLGSMFNHAGRKAFEATQGCTFAECLRAGRTVRIYASEMYLDMLSRYSTWKFGQPLEILRSETIGAVHFHEVRVAGPVSK